MNNRPYSSQDVLNAVYDSASGKLRTVNVGGGTGTTDYEQLENKPQINGITLEGNKTSTNLGLQPAITVESKLPVEKISGLSTVATSGNYADLSGKPTIVSSVNGESGVVSLTPAKVGALSLTGGTITGDLQITGKVGTSEISFGDRDLQLINQNGVHYYGTGDSYFKNLTVGADGLTVQGGTTGQILQVSQNGNLEYSTLSASSVGALPISGGTLTGDLSVQGQVFSSGESVSTLTATEGVVTIPAESGHIYEYTAVAGDSFVFQTPTAGDCPEFELDIQQPATAVSFTLPTGIVWRFGTPDLSTAGRLYQLKFRYLNGTWEGWTTPEMSEYLKKVDSTYITIHDPNTGGDVIRFYKSGNTPSVDITPMFGQVYFECAKLFLNSPRVILGNKELNSKGGLISSSATTGNITSPGDVIATTSGGTIAMSELANRVIPADTIPTAGATYADKVYLYTGTTSDSYKHGHLYQCKLVDSNYVWVDTQTGLYGVGNLTNIKCYVIGGQVTLKWTGPDSTKIGDVTVAELGKIVLVRKSGSLPSSVDDGTILVTSTSKDEYSSTPFHESIPSGETYYYRWFIYTEDGVLNDNSSNSAVTGELTWATILDMCRDPNVDMREVFSAKDILTASNSVRPTDGQGNFEWQITDVTHDDFGLAAYKSFASLQFDPSQKPYALTGDSTFATWKWLSLTGYGTTNGDYFLKDETATGTDRVWRRKTGTMEIKYAGGKWIVFNFSSSTTAASQTTSSADPWDGEWNNSVVVAKSKKYYTTDGVGNYTEAVVTDGTSVTLNTYYEKNPDQNWVNYGSNHYEGSPIDQMLNSNGEAGTYFSPRTIFSNTPSWVNSQAGFMKGWDPDFLTAVKDTQVAVNLNTVIDGGGQTSIIRKFYLLSAQEVGSDGGEGSILTMYVGAKDADRIKYPISGGATYWWLRSPVTSNSCNVRHVNSSGGVHYYYALNSSGVVPACRIG